MATVGKLLLASLVAVVAGAIAGGLALAGLHPDAHYRDPAWWAAGVAVGFMFLLYAIPLGLLPGLLLHTLLLRLGWTSVWQYIAGATLVGVFWCVVTRLTLLLVTPVLGYILASSIIGTVAFWIARRPDKQPASGVKVRPAVVETT
jgi:hypothetical protein